MFVIERLNMQIHNLGCLIRVSDNRVGIDVGVGIEESVLEKKIRLNALLARLPYLYTRRHLVKQTQYMYSKYIKQCHCVCIV